MDVRSKTRPSFDWGGSRLIRGGSRAENLKIQISLFDDGEYMIFELRGIQGWLRDLDGHSHRFKRLGSVTFLEKKHQSKHVCEGCETRFDSEIALKMHRGGGWCRGNFEVMSIEEQVKLRRTRVATATRRGKTVRRWSQS